MKCGMAKIIVKRNGLYRAYAVRRALMVLGFAVFGLSILLLALGGVRMGKGVVFALLFGLFGGAALGYGMRKKVRILKAGVHGEAGVEKILRRLPGDFVGYRNVRAAFDGQSSELDMVVVGPTGVFIVETKNMRGQISGSYDSAQWVQGKIGRGGTPYSSRFYSPVKQVGTHTYRLAHVLRNAGSRVRIHPVVYFSNMDAAVQVCGTGETPVFAASHGGAEDMLAYIANRPAILTARQMQSISKVLEQL